MEFNIIKDKEAATKVITELFDKYENDRYMYQKLNNYICNQMNGILENIHDQHNKRVTRMTELTSEQDNFIQTFLNNNQYFYSNSTDNFFYYNGLHYELYNEDDILYNVLNTITQGGSLMSWKQKTKLNIMKRIRETSLLHSIPESDTIQSVIDGMCPLLFQTRAETKHFLTILGDNIFRKQSSLIYLIDPNAKFFLKQLNHICQMFIGCNLSQTFKHKYHDHNYKDCRIVKINRSVKNYATWGQVLKQNILDIICVACHYSLRYKSADEFIENYCNSDKLPDNVFYIKNMNISTLVDEFVTNVIDVDDKQVVESSIVQISWKNMQYLWKQFLMDKELPGLVFLQNLKTMLIEKLQIYYKEETDNFIGICSKHLPTINTFISFWNKTMIEDDYETDLEVEEVIIMFRKWCETNNMGVSNLNDKKIIDLLGYYYPTVEIEQDKYISKFRCSLWDKQLDIQIAMDSLKVNMQTEMNNLSSNSLNQLVNSKNYRNISIYDAYSSYCKYATSSVAPSSPTNIKLQNNQKQIVSKAYFEKYIFDNYQEYIIDSKFISNEWYIE